MIINPSRFAGAGGFDGFGNNSFAFDGADQYIQVSSSVLDGNATATVAAWIKLDSLNLNQTVVGGIDNVNSLRVMVRTTNQLDAIWSYGSTFFVSTLDGATINSGAWTHVAVTFNSSGDLIRYINGSQTGVADDMSATGVFANLSADIGIGARRRFSGADFDLPLDGNICDVRFYDAELSASDIADLANGVDVQTNLTHWYLDDDNDFNDNTGAINAVTGGGGTAPTFDSGDGPS
jgi:hypothetical protein